MATSEKIRASIEQTLLREAQRNELTIAWVRLVVVGITAAFEWAGVLAGKLPLGMGLTITVWLALAAGLIVLLRRRPYGRGLAFATSGLDAIFLLLEHLVAWAGIADAGIDPESLTASYSITCSLLALSGALRLTRGMVFWSSGLAMATLVAGNFAVGAFRTPASALFPVALLVGTTILSLRLLDVVRRAMSAEVAKQTLKRFLPSGVIEGAHQDPLALITEPRLLDATVLATDLRGFTALSEGLRPAQVLAFLNEVQGAFAHVIHEHGGTVDKFIGDGMLAVFGAPAPLADHAARAVSAARGIRAALVVVNAARVARGEEPVRVGVGVHSGPIVTGCLGGDERLELTIVGDTVNVASRLEGLTKEHGVDVLVSEESSLRAGTPQGLTLLGEVAVRGRTAALRVFTLDG